MDITLTHGVLPDEADFYKQFQKHMTDCNLYHIHNDPVIGTAHFNAVELWNFVKLFHNSNKPEYVELVSCIFETLSIEWV